VVSTGVETLRIPLPATLALALGLLIASSALASRGAIDVPSRRAGSGAAAEEVGPGDLVLVLPFTGAAEDGPDWLGAGAARYLVEAVRLAGFRAVDEEDRRAALHESGLLDAPRIPLASTLVLARRLGARHVLTGGWAFDGGRLRLHARAMDAEALSLLAEAEAVAGGSGPEAALAALARELTGEAGLQPAAREGLERLAAAPPAALAGWMQAAAESQQAEEYLRAALELAPELEPARLALAEHLLDSGRPEAAGPVLAGVETSAHRHRRARALALEGRLALALGDADGAVRSLELAVAQLPETGTLLWLAEAQLAAGDPGGAGSTVRQALALAPADREALELLDRAREAGAEP
jgi:tetratricopeptide (TPR) repeat protein